MNVKRLHQVRRCGPSGSSPRLWPAAAALLAPGVASAHGGEGALFVFGAVAAIGLTGLICLLVSTSVLSRVTAFAVGLLACAVAYLAATKTIPMRLGSVGSFLLGLLPPLGASIFALVWGALQER